MDPATREALTHATAGDWRAWAPYVDRLLDEALAAREARDVADLETLYRADVATDDVVLVHIPAARPFDHGADWAV
jgi:hypothetical protein